MTEREGHDFGCHSISGKKICVGWQSSVRLLANRLIFTLPWQHIHTALAAHLLAVCVCVCVTSWEIQCSLSYSLYLQYFCTGDNDMSMLDKCWELSYKAIGSMSLMRNFSSMPMFSRAAILICRVPITTVFEHCHPTHPAASQSHLGYSMCTWGKGTSSWREWLEGRYTD